VRLPTVMELITGLSALAKMGVIRINRLKINRYFFIDLIKLTDFELKIFKNFGEPISQ